MTATAGSQLIPDWVVSAKVVGDGLGNMAVAVDGIGLLVGVIDEVADAVIDAVGVSLAVVAVAFA
jgi:hypothetical protein